MTDERDYNTIETIALTQTIPFGVYNKPRAAVMYYFGAREISDILETINIGGTGNTLITDSNGTILCSTGSKELATLDILEQIKDPSGFLHIGDKDNKMIIMYKTSSYSGWKYISILPYKNVMEKAINIKYSFVLITALTVAIALMFSCLLSYRNSRPIMRIVNTIKEMFYGESSKYKSEYEYIQRGIFNLVQRNRSLMDNINDQQSLIKHMFVDRILNGEIPRADEIEATLTRYTDLQFRSDIYCVIAGGFAKHKGSTDGETLIRMDMYRAIIHEAIGSTLNNSDRININSHVVNQYETVLIVGLRGMEHEEAFRIVEKAAEEISIFILDKYGVKAFFGIGEMVSKLENIFMSYNKAHLALQHIRKSNSNKNILLAQNIDSNQNNLYYPMEIENQFISVVKSGEKLKAIDLLNSIIAQNTINGSLEFVAYFEILATIVKAADQIHNSSEIITDVLSLFKCKHPYSQSVMNKMNAHVLSLCDLVEKNRDSHNKKQINDIVSFINSNYADPNFCIYHVADEFNISSVYASNFFKEKIGETFSKYLEKLRMDLACRLLNDKKYSIDEVAKMSGYNSAHSFRRAFGRVFGITPSKYKQI